MLVHGMGGRNWGPFVRAFFLEQWDLPALAYPSSHLLMVRTSPMGSVGERARQLEGQIDEWADRFHWRRPQELHLVGHSMGGLDSRLLIHRLENSSGNMKEPRSRSWKIRSLTTIGTPHRGSAVADVLGTPLEPLLSAFPWLRAPLELTRKQAARFNAEVLDAAGCGYFSVAAAVPCPPRWHPLRAPWRCLDALEGPNDGLVSASSARWGALLAELPIDHLAQLGWALPGATPKAHAMLQLIVDALRRLDAEDGCLLKADAVPSSGSG
ncbi:MAG: hypothetical protein Q8P67_19925 [archaeon]|nr:hypothetical protein [archaeon]